MDPSKMQWRVLREKDQSRVSRKRKSNCGGRAESMDPHWIAFLGDQDRLHKLEAGKPRCLLVERQCARTPGPRSKLCDQRFCK